MFDCTLLLYIYPHSKQAPKAEGSLLTHSLRWQPLFYVCTQPEHPVWSHLQPPDHVPSTVFTKLPWSFFKWSQHCLLGHLSFLASGQWPEELLHRRSLLIFPSRKSGDSPSRQGPLPFILSHICCHLGLHGCVRKKTNWVVCGLKIAELLFIFSGIKHFTSFPKSWHLWPWFKVSGFLG